MRRALMERGAPAYRYPHGLFFVAIALLFAFLTACQTQVPRPVPSIPTGSFVEITSQRSTSHFSPGMSNVGTSLFSPWRNNHPEAVQRAKALIKDGLSFLNQHIMAWGADDPWPDPGQDEPENWSTLDQKLQIAIETRATPVITLCEAPWWMKGQLQSDGTTQLLTRDDDFKPIATASRILDNKMDAWLKLVQRVAERYMVAPYHVRYFQVWNELKGYYNPTTNNWDISTSSGNPSGPYAEHGYTYMYNRVYTTLKHVAIAKGIEPASVQVGGPYVALNTWSDRSRPSSPSRFTRAYGIYDQRDLDAVRYWLQYKEGAEFITVDGENGNKDGKDQTDPFTASEKFADVVHWIRSLDAQRYPGATTLPIWWAEWYADTPTNDPASLDAVAAVKAYAIIKLIKAGGAVALQWGGTGEGEKDTNRGLWTPTDTPDGGQPSRWYHAYKAFKDYFGPGTVISQTKSSPDIEALVSPEKALFVNKTARTLTMAFQGTTVRLRPYQVTLLETSAQRGPIDLRMPGVLFLIMIIMGAGILFFMRRRVSCSPYGRSSKVLSIFM